MFLNTAFVVKIVIIDLNSIQLKFQAIFLLKKQRVILKLSKCSKMHGCGATVSRNRFHVQKLGQITKYWGLSAFQQYATLVGVIGTSPRHATLHFACLRAFPVRMAKPDGPFYPQPLGSRLSIWFLPQYHKKY